PHIARAAARIRRAAHCDAKALFASLADERIGPRLREPVDGDADIDVAPDRIGRDSEAFGAQQELADIGRKIPRCYDSCGHPGLGKSHDILRYSVLTSASAGNRSRCVRLRSVRRRFRTASRACSRMMASARAPSRFSMASTTE